MEIFIAYSLLTFLLLVQVGVTALLVLYMVSWVQSAYKGAPFVPSRREHVKELLIFGGLKRSDVVCDLGCGDGRILISVVNDFNVTKTIGYEIAFWPYYIACLKIRIQKLNDKIIIRRKDLRVADLQGVSFVYAYLFPKIVDVVASKIEKELSLGSKILVLSFPIDIRKHEKMRLIKSEKIGKITAYLYEKI